LLVEENRKKTLNIKITLPKRSFARSSFRSPEGDLNLPSVTTRPCPFQKGFRLSALRPTLSDGLPLSGNCISAPMDADVFIYAKEVPYK
jgi:hypothetical protein